MNRLSIPTDKFIDRTRRLWKRRLGRDLSREDAQLITKNVAGFFTALAEWSRAECLAPGNDNNAHAVADEVGHER